MKRPNLRAVEPPSSAGRPPPHDLDAEASTLSAIMLSRGALDRVRDLLEPRHFYSPSNAWIYEAALVIAKRGDAVDIVSVASELRAAKLLEKAGGAAYLAQIADATPNISNVETHARIVWKLAQRRELIATCQVAAAEGYGDVDDDWIAHVEVAIAKVTRARSDDRTVDLDRALTWGFGAIRKAETQKGILGMSTGLRDLDAATAGLFGGEIVFIGAKRGGGKSSLAGNIAVAVASAAPELLPPNEDDERTGDRRYGPRNGVFIASMEMPHEQYALRMACSEGSVDFHRVRAGTATSEDWSSLYSAAAALKSLPILIDDTPKMSLAQLRAKIERAIVRLLEEHGAELRLVVIDYIQLMSTAGCAEENDPNRERSLAALGQAIKDLRLAYPNVAWVVLSQLNVDGILRESSALEMAADSIWIVESDEPRKPRFDGDVVRGPATARIKLKKQRNGDDNKVVEVLFYKSFTRFGDVS